MARINYGAQAYRRDNGKRKLSRLLAAGQFYRIDDGPPIEMDSLPDEIDIEIVFLAHGGDAKRLASIGD